MDPSARRLEAAGAEISRGDLDDLDVISKAATNADGVIHLAYRSDLLFSGDAAGVVAANLKVIEVAGEALERTGKPFVAPVGTLALWAGGITGGLLGDSENATDALAERGVRSVVIRQAPVVHSALDTQGFTPAVIGIAREKGVAVRPSASMFAAADNPTSSALTRQRLGGEPIHPGLIADLDEGHYFAWPSIADDLRGQLS